MTTTLGKKGEIVIPLEVREKHKLQPGDDFEIISENSEDVIRLRPIRRRANDDLVEALRGLRGLAVPARRRQIPRKPRL